MAGLGEVQYVPRIGAVCSRACSSDQKNGLRRQNPSMMLGMSPQTSTNRVDANAFLAESETRLHLQPG